MRLLFILLTLGAIGYGAWQISQTHPEMKNTVEKYLPAQEFHTLEIRYTAEQIMSSHRKELLKSHQHKYLESQLRFYPYVLMEVKYCPTPKKTQESLILWDLCDGEMVLETKGWEKTHGFGDCILAGTDRYEFKVINLLAKKGGSCDREDLIKGLHLENNVLDSLIDKLRQKQLLVFSGNQYRLHLQKPMLKTYPETKINERLVTKTWKNAHKISKRFSLAQIEKLAQAAFGDDFAIRHTSDVYLPVHSIVVQNPDGSVHTSLWNALNGKRILYSHSID
jgi:hypothetical protein